MSVDRHLPWTVHDGETETPGTHWWHIEDSRGNTVVDGDYNTTKSGMQFIADAVNNHDRLEATERRYKELAQPGRYVYNLSDGSGWLLCALGEDKPISRGSTPEEAIDAAIERQGKTL